jgi:hypothetical protein
MTTLKLPTLSSSHPASSAYNSTVIQYLSTSSADTVDWSTKGGAGAQSIRNSRGEVFTNEIGEQVSVLGKDQTPDGQSGQTTGVEDDLADLGLAENDKSNAT